MPCQPTEVFLSVGWTLAGAAWATAFCIGALASWRVATYRRTMVQVTRLYRVSMDQQAAQYAEALTTVRADYERQLAARRGLN